MALIDPRKKKKAAGTTWTNRNDLIIQAKEGSEEKTGEHVSRHRGDGGKGKPSWWQKTRSDFRRKTGGDMTTAQKTTSTTKTTPKKKKYVSPYERKHGRKQKR